MSASKLERVVPANGHVLYLDTSALFSLALVEAAVANEAVANETDRRRAARLKTFCAKLAAQGGKVVCSILAFEEIAALTRNNSLRGSVQAYGPGASDMRDLERKDPAAAHAARTNAHDDTIEMLDFSLDGLQRVSGVVKHPWGGEPDTASQGESVRRTHRNLLEKYPMLDSMDALHMTFGVMLGCTHLVSFDRHWGEIDEGYFDVLS